MLYNFAGSPGDGANPYAGLAIGSGIGGHFVLYGTTTMGGSSDSGTVYSLTPSNGGTWTEKVLYSFRGAEDGALPQAGITIGRGPGEPVLYGTSAWGGAAAYSLGAVFSLSPPAIQGGEWTETTLHTFPTVGQNDGANPYAGVVLSPGGVLYGTTFAGGLDESGTLYSLTPPASPGSAWTETLLHLFNSCNCYEGVNPWGLALGSGPSGQPVLYGTTEAGGFAGGGTVYSFTP